MSAWEEISVPIQFYPANGGAFEDSMADFSVTVESGDTSVGEPPSIVTATFVSVQIGDFRLTRAALVQMLTDRGHGRDGEVEVRGIEAGVAEGYEIDRSSPYYDREFSEAENE